MNDVNAELRAQSVKCAKFSCNFTSISPCECAAHYLYARTHVALLVGRREEVIQNAASTFPFDQLTMLAGGGIHAINKATSLQKKCKGLH
jgi:hypothetical protein